MSGKSDRYKTEHRREKNKRRQQLQREKNFAKNKARREANNKVEKNEI